MSVSDTRLSPGPSSPGPLRERSGWIVALGVVYRLAGILAFENLC